MRFHCQTNRCARSAVLPVTPLFCSSSFCSECFPSHFNRNCIFRAVTSHGAVQDTWGGGGGACLGEPSPPSLWHRPQPAACRFSHFSGQFVRGEASRSSVSMIWAPWQVTPAVSWGGRAPCHKLQTSLTLPSGNALRIIFPTSLGPDWYSYTEMEASTVLEHAF